MEREYPWSQEVCPQERNATIVFTNLSAKDERPRPTGRKLGGLLSLLLSLIAGLARSCLVLLSLNCKEKPGEEQFYLALETQGLPMNPTVDPELSCPRTRD